MLAFLFAHLLAFGEAYRVGDAVDTDVRTNLGTEDALRNQMPVFGVDSTTTFHLDGVSKFSLSFEEGLRPLPFMDTKGGRLEKVSVTFVYSRSGDGTIHTITSTAEYSNTPHKKGFRVHYEWVEEELVDIVGASAVMFMATFLATVIVLIKACSVMGLGELDDDLQYNTPIDYSDAYAFGVPSGTTQGEPKWD
jgi:hypothetical protein